MKSITHVSPDPHVTIASSPTPKPPTPTSLPPAQLTMGRIILWPWLFVNETHSPGPFSIDVWLEQHCPTEYWWDAKLTVKAGRYLIGLDGNLSAPITGQNGLPPRERDNMKWTMSGWARPGVYYRREVYSAPPIPSHTAAGPSPALQNRHRPTTTRITPPPPPPLHPRHRAGP